MQTNKYGKYFTINYELRLLVNFFTRRLYM
jgi:hypothetical protein